jgi:hypothetical protein
VAPTDRGVRSILFIGNSLTYSNDLPGMVRTLVSTAVHGPITVHTIALPDYSLEDHWAKGTVQRVIEEGHWDVVVLQQGPSSLEASRALLIDYVSRFAQVIRAAGGTPALYMVWPTRDRFQDFARSSESHRMAAAASNALLFPVGDAWRAAWRRDSTLGLFASDGIHPSVLGSYLGALVVAQGLTHQASLSMPETLVVEGGPTIRVSPGVAKLLQDAATEVADSAMKAIR